MTTSFKQDLIGALKNFPIKRASLFGSFARGDEGPDSDIDVLIDFDSPLSLFDLIRMEQTLSQKLSRKVDIVEFSAIKPSIKDRILSQAIPLI